MWEQWNPTENALLRRGLFVCAKIIGNVSIKWWFSYASSRFGTAYAQRHIDRLAKRTLIVWLVLTRWRACNELRITLAVMNREGLTDSPTGDKMLPQWSGPFWRSIREYFSIFSSTTETSTMRWSCLLRQTKTMQTDLSREGAVRPELFLSVGTHSIKSPVAYSPIAATQTNKIVRLIILK